MSYPNLYPQNLSSWKGTDKDPKTLPTSHRLDRISREARQMTHFPSSSNHSVWSGPEVTKGPPRDQTGNKWWRSESQRLRPRFQHSVYPLLSAGGVRRRRPTVSKILLSFSHHGPSICWALGSPPSHGLILAYRTYILWSLSSFHLPSLNEGFSSTIISYLMVWSASIARPVHYTPRIIHDGLSRSCLTSFPRFALSLGLENYIMSFIP